MKRFPALILATAILLSPWTGPALAQGEYEPPYPHSTGAQLLPYCQATDTPVDLLRCDYYVQGVADLATTPVNGKPLACIPRGKNRTELMELVVAKLSALKPDELEQSSAAALILAAFKREFRCPRKTAGDKGKKAEITPAMEEALRKAFLEKARADKAAAGEAGTQ
jgi:hypothetical protein